MNQLYKRIKELENNIFKKNTFLVTEIKNNIFYFNEKNNVKYEINITNESIAIFNIENKGKNKKIKFKDIVIQNCSDVIFISKNNNDNCYKLDILEIKSSINNDIIDKLSNQLIGGYLRVMSILASLHLNINEINFYVALYRDKKTNNELYKNEKLNNTKIRERFHTLSRWEENKLFIDINIPNSFFNRNYIDINKLIYDNYHNNNNSATITFPKK